VRVLGIVFPLPFDLDETRSARRRLKIESVLSTVITSLPGSNGLSSFLKRKPLVDAVCIPFPVSSASTPRFGRYGSAVPCVEFIFVGWQDALQLVSPRKMEDVCQSYISRRDGKSVTY
jgi:hypothetical protein